MIKWSGGQNPVHEDSVVQYTQRNGLQSSGIAWQLEWGHDGSGSDIIGYEVIG